MAQVSGHHLLLGGLIPRHIIWYAPRFMTRRSKDALAAHKVTGGHRSCLAMIGSPAHSCMAARLSRAGCLTAAGPSANARRTLAVTRLVKCPHCRVIPQ